MTAHVECVSLLIKRS